MHALPKEDIFAQKFSLKSLSHWDSATEQLVPPKEHSFAQVPLPLGLGHLPDCSSQGTQPRSRASPPGTRPLSSLFLPRNTASLKCLPPGTQPPSSLFLLKNTASLKASPTRTRPPSSLFLPRNTASLKCLPHWDSATKQLILPKEHSLAQVPLPLGLDHLAACSKKHSLAQVPIPLGLGHQPACSSQGTQPRSSASPTGTRPPSDLFLPRNTASLKCLSHWDSATKQLVPLKEHSLAQVPLPLGLGHLPACSKEHSLAQEHNLALSASSHWDSVHPSSLFLLKNTASLKASPLGLCPPSSLFLPRNTASLKGLLPLGLDLQEACSSQGNTAFAQGPLPTGTTAPRTCSSQGTQLAQSASSTGTRPPCSLFLLQETQPRSRPSPPGDSASK
ncbi:hypothetical protein Adt_28521 [Abeliophyllum distichum]|uniref:Uncharacterized protein n=1 Tax=Abeliophyllum distichum TaxID=126358 RepID=A0ABD1RYW7_9LAMI